jgi:hypothetical protein
MATRYSRWDPATGGWSYYDAPDPLPNLNDDLPTPQLVSASSIGVPSIEAGRPLPSSAVYVGQGESAQGLIAPVEQSRLVSRTGPLAGVSASVQWGSMALGVLIGFLIAKQPWKRGR